MSNAKFKKSLINQLEEIGYEKFKGDSDLRFVKSVGNGFYNILLLTFSRYDRTAFTGDFFLSLYPSDFYEEHGQRRMYRKRIGFFLQQKERLELLNNSKEKVNVNGGDAWWYSNDLNVIENFVRAVSITTPRFLSQEGIYQQVLSNEILRWYYNKDTLKIIEIAYSGELDKKEYKLVPKSDPDKIGINWFKAAEIYITEYTKIRSSKKNWVKRMASEAYMTDKYQKLYGDYNPILLELKQKSFEEFLNK